VPARLRDLVRALAEFGITVQRPNHGSHWKAIAPDGKKYTIPAHNAERSEVGDEYLRALCRTFGIDLQKLKEFL
jgi:predicted RNA binding protein YcfA (HicA-like mRNA interferase family)